MYIIIINYTFHNCVCVDVVLFIFRVYADLFDFCVHGVQSNKRLFTVFFNRADHLLVGLRTQQ